jgi:UDP-glucose 4-epimerase
MNVLVTGGAGFIGSHLCDALMESGHQVWCVDNLYLGREANIAHLATNTRFVFKKLDVLDRSGMDDLFSSVAFDMVFHMAANSDIQQGSVDHEVDLKLTFQTTYEVLEHMLRRGVKKIFFASTSAVFGETDDTLHENYGPLKPISFYGASKLAAESYLSVYANNYGFNTWILRFPNVVGERATHGAIYDFIARLKNDPRKLVVLGNGTQSKPYLYVKDLVDAILTVVAQSAESLAVYHVGNNDQTTVKQIAEIVVAEMGLKETTIEYTGGDRGWVGDVPFFKYDMSKIQALGFKQRYNSTESVHMAIRRILGKE